MNASSKDPAYQSKTSSPGFRIRRRAVILAALMAFFGTPVFADDPVEVEVGLSMKTNIDQLITRIPASGDSARVHLMDNTDPYCASHALRVSRNALNAAGIRTGAWESIKITADIAQDILSLYGLGLVADVIEFSIAALDASSVEEYVMNTLQSSLKFAVGKTMDELGDHFEMLDDELIGLGASKGTGWLWDAILEGTEGKLHEDVYQHPLCGPINITIWLQKAGEFGLELRMSMSGDCHCAIPDGDPVKLAGFSVYGVVPLNVTTTKDEDSIKLSFNLKDQGEYWVRAVCGCPDGEDESGSGMQPDGPSDDPTGFIPSDEYTTADLICFNRCKGLRSSFDSADMRADSLERKSEEGKTDPDGLRNEASALEDEANNLEQAYEEALELVRTPISGSPSPSQMKALEDAHATIDSWGKGDSRRATELREQAKAKGEEADQWENAEDRAAKEAEAARAEADQRWARYQDCLKKCIREACSAGESFGTGDALYGTPTGSDQIQEDIKDLIDKMRREEGLQCKPFGLGAADSNISYAPDLIVTSARSEWCTYGETSQPVPTSTDPGPPGVTTGGGIGSPTTPGSPPSTPGGAPKATSTPRPSPAPEGRPPDPGYSATPTGTTPPVDGVPTTPQPPSIPVPEEEDDPESTPDEPEEPPEEEEPPSPPPNLTIKAKQTVLLGETATAVAVPEAMIKLDLGPEPEIPIEGNQRVDVGYDEPPVQGLTGTDGSLQLAVTTALAASLPSNGLPEIEVDLTPTASTIVQIEPDPARGTATPTQYLHPDLVPFVSRHWFLNGTMVTVLVYPKTRAAAVGELVALSSGVVHSEPNYCREKEEGPDDPFFHSRGSWEQEYDDQWAIKRVGFTGDANSAWMLLGSAPAPVVVAVIDTGLDWNHQDISWESVWRNEIEIPGNGIDDDENGYIDDVIGWDFVDGDGSPWDRDGHGTFVSGVIAATSNNGVGITGINPYAKIMVLRALNSFGQTRAADLAEAIVYASNNGARVINISAGGANLTRTEQAAVDYAYEKGAVIVVAAGNEGIDAGNFAPAGLAKVIAVAATDTRDKRAVFSNWGSTIDLAAPGIDILSLRARRTDLMLAIPGVSYEPRQAWVGEDTRYFRSSGTSFAAPIVAGVASLILTDNPSLTNEQVERKLLYSANDAETPGFDQYTGHGIVDARAALRADPSFFLEARIDGVEVVRVDDRPAVRVHGRSRANDFARAWLEIGSGEAPTSWKMVTEIEAPVLEGELATIDAENFRGGSVWTLRLITEHSSGRVTEARFRLNLGG